jgi:hypothetical protein
MGIIGAAGLDTPGLDALVTLVPVASHAKVIRIPPWNPTAREGRTALVAF